MSEFIGARISLISRSDIRYVGTLFEIDSEQSTVSLERVQSHGTEGRCADPEKEVPGADNIYEFIVFRGSDVKDLRIESAEEAAKAAAPQVPDDPAILGTQAPPRANYPPMPPYPSGPPGPPGPPQFNPQGPPPPGQFPGYPQLPPGPSGYYGQYGNQNRFMPQPPYMMPGYSGTFPPGGPGPYGMPPNGRGMPPSGPMNQGPPRGQAGRGGSGQPSPPVQGQQGFGATQQAGPSEMPASLPTNPPPPPMESKPDVATALAPPATNGAAQAGKGRGRINIVPAVPAVSPRPAVAAVVPPPPSNAPNAPRNAPAQTNGMKDLETKVQEMRVSNGAGHHTNEAPGTGGYVANRGRGRGRGDYRGRGHFRGGFNATQQQHKVEVPASDYDFESANARFAKVSDPAVIAPTAASENDATGLSPAPNGDGSSQDDVVIPPPAAADGFYNKSSFFDNISCENKDRADAREGERPRGGAQWRGEEVKKNMETFGQGSVDSGYGRRGGFRGRGRGGFVSRGGPYRGRANGGADRGSSGVPGPTGVVGQS